MSLADAILAENRNVEQLRGLIDEVTREVASLQAKLDHQEEVVEVFGDDPAAVGVAAAKSKLDKCEERLIAAKLRLDAAYNRFTTTVESANKTARLVRESIGLDTGVLLRLAVEEEG